MWVGWFLKFKPILISHGVVGWLLILKANPILQREGVAEAGNVSAKLYRLFSIIREEGWVGDCSMMI